MTTFHIKLDVLSEVLEWSVMNLLPPTDWPRPSIPMLNENDPTKPTLIGEYKATVIVRDEKLAIEFKLRWSEYILQEE